MRAIADIRQRTLQTNGIAMRVLEAGEGRPVMLLHGFPETAGSWHHQIRALADTGHRVIAPDQRGYGGTDRPDAIEAYDIEHLAGDLTGLLDAVDEPSAVFVGHDWGAAVAWLLARLAPERVEAVVGLSVPATPWPSRPPAEALARERGDRFHYIVYFQEPGVADAELDREVERSLRAWYGLGAGRAFESAPPREGVGVLDVLGDPGPHPDWLDREALTAAVADFERSGFTGGLNWYRNLDRNRELTRSIAGAAIDQPALFVAGTADPVLKMWPPSLMDGLVGDLRGCRLIEGAGHWIQQERPEEVNAVLLEFLDGLPARVTVAPSPGQVS